MKTYLEIATELANSLDAEGNLNDKLRERLINNLVDKMSARDMINGIEEGKYTVKKSGNSFLYIRKDSS